MKTARLIGAILLVLAAAGGSAHAAAGAWQTSERVEARLVSAVDGVGDLARVPMGIELRIADGWKTYWRSPGDAGLPARVDWSGSDNLAEAAISWPAPLRFTLFDLQTFGYGGEVVLPVGAVPVAPGEPLALNARLDLLVCSNVCVPETFDLALALPAGPATPGTEAQLVNRFAARVPGQGAAVGLAVETVRAVALGDGAALEVVATAREPFVAPDLFVEADPYLAFGEPAVQLGDNGRRALITLPVQSEIAPDRGLAGRAVTLTLVDGPRAMEQATEIASGTAVESSFWARFGLMIALAVAGGLVLNLMPCVLPVLSLKLLSLVKHGGETAGVRASFLATAAGIVFSFMLIALGLMALEAAGRTIGWGVQFQQPVFIAAMVVLVTLFACNLWGLFELPMPRFLAASGPRGDGLAGHFATGAFATLLATPCSAPFLGTAVGFALAAGGATIPAIFLALGVGLALPYLVVAAIPRLARHLPRPGRWMLTLRRILGLALAGTGIWLLTVMAAQRGTDIALMVGGFMLAIVATLALRRAVPIFGTVAALALAAAALAVPAVQGHAERDDGVARGGAIEWVAFDRDAVRGLVAQGRTVLVDVTADWCITCQANKSLVLEGSELADRLADRAVAMRADWTLPDEEIAAYLASHGRYGIPFNVVYGPGSPQGIVLPEILTERVVHEALDRASLPVQAGLGY